MNTYSFNGFFCQGNFDVEILEVTIWGSCCLIILLLRVLLMHCLSPGAVHLVELLSVSVLTWATTTMILLHLHHLHLLHHHGVLILNSLLLGLELSGLLLLSLLRAHLLA